MINVIKENFNEFMMECGKAPLLTTEQEKLYIEQAQQGDQEAMQTVLNANMRFVVSIANACKGNLDIISAIRVAEPGLIYAVKHYDTASDTKFIAYAAECMKECFKRNMLQLKQMSDECVREKFACLTDREREVMQMLIGHERACMSINEVANKLQLTPIRIRQIRDKALEKINSMKSGPTMHKTKIFVDMDGVLVNFQSGIDKLDEATKRKYADDPSRSTLRQAQDKRSSEQAGSGQARKAHYDDVPGIFATMDPMPGALDAVRALQAMGYDLYILSTAPWGNPSAWADKVAWVTKHLDDVFHKKMIITHCKGLLAAQEEAYLIDDRTGHGASDFGERHIQFGQERFPDWTSVVDYFRQFASLALEL